MSLFKQLWIAIALVMTIAFGGSMLVSVLSARHYLEQQLQVKNIDNATTLALSLSQLDKDPTTVELQVSAQFDVGHYRFIRIVSPDGRTLVEREFAGNLQEAPRWFMDLFPIRTAPGQALIQDGWKQYGTLTLASHEQYAYQSLWNGTLELLMWFVLGSVLAGLAGSLLMRLITRPLNDVVDQAQAIAERRFLTIQEPRTPELRAVSRAMNAMVERLKTLFAEEASRLENLRQKVNRDAVTGLASRDYFMSHLHDIINNEQFSSVGSLVMVRLIDLQAINTTLGRQRADDLLKQLGQVLQDSCQDHPGQRAGRVKGGEFAIICPSQDSPSAAAQDIHTRLLRDWLPLWADQLPALFTVAGVRYQRGQSPSDLLARADQALALAQTQGINNWHVVQGHDSTKLALPAAQWRTLLSEALSGDRLRLAFFPVVKAEQGAALHQEGVIRLMLDAAGHTLSAGDFMPMAASLNLTAPIDLGVVKLAMAHLRTNPGDVAVNLSAETLVDAGFRNDLAQLLHGEAALCKRLLFEVPEHGVFRHFEAFRELVRNLKTLGCRVGIEYFGQHFSESGKLASLGLDYIKVHPSYIRGIAHNPGNQEFLKGLCSVARNFGIVVIALGVESEADLALLASLGFDGMTGPGVK